MEQPSFLKENYAPLLSVTIMERGPSPTTFFSVASGSLIIECNTINFCYRGDHTETIDIDYDPNEVTYSELLDLFWKNHDPTAKTTLQVCYCQYL
jgi:hypothetical protein